MGKMIDMGFAPKSGFANKARQSMTRVLLGGVALSLVTFLASPFETHRGAIALIYLMIVAVVSLTGDLGSSASIAIAAALCLRYFFAPPPSTPGIDKPLDVAALITFLATAAIITRLISKMQRLTEELRRRETYLAEAQRLSHTGSFGWRLSTGEFLWSEETFRIFQYDRTTKPTVERILERVHPEDAALVKQTIERASQNGNDFEHEYRLVMPDSSVKYIHVVAHALSDESDGIEFVGAVMDVTAVKQAEEALRRSESYLAEAQRLTHTGSWAWRVAGREALHLSEEWYRIYGFDPEEGLSAWKQRLQRMHPEDRANWQETTDRAIREKSDYEVEHRILLPGGTVKYTHTVGHPVLNASGDVVQFVGIMMDVTERKRAEALRDGESRILEMIARDAPLEEILEKLVLVVEAHFAGLLCSVLLLDEDGQHARHGAAPSLPKAYADAIDGLSIGPKAGSCGTAMYRREPVVVSDILQDPLWEAYRHVAEPYGLRACWSTPIVAHSGRTLGSFAMYYREPRNPSPAETRALELATHLAGIAMERKLAREERERLRRAQADLAHINRVTTMGELTASLAHEVNQPIAAAVTNAKTCLRWLTRDQPDVEEARAAAMRIVNDGTRAAEIIKRIRLLFKKGTSERELVDVNEVIREMVVLLRGEAMRYSILVRTELEADSPRVMADRVQLQQVLMNLMINGIDAMKDVVGTRDLAIKSQRAENEQVQVSVSDTGVGFPAQQADQIFNAFFTTKPHGTGMGLSISRSIVESHGGRLWAANNSPRGASFRFALPTNAEAKE
jgi:PAS domain S-box-containing protein